MANQSWREFLVTQGAVCAQGAVRDFGDSAAERGVMRDGNILLDLSHFALIRVAGADREAFLNGQLTNDIKQVDAAHSQVSAWCSPKGRMLAVFRVFRRGESLLLQLPISLRDAVLQRLRMYILRSKVTLDIADETLVRLGIAGPNAPSLLSDACGTTPAENNEAAVSDGMICARLPGIHPRFELLADFDRAVRLWTELKRDAVPAGAAAWTWHDIMAGIPVVLPRTSDAFVPQMMNLDLIDGVSFDKGCYTGQEIVARLHYRGRLKQRMYRAHVNAEALPVAGDPIYAPQVPGQSTGTVVIATAAPDDGYDLLAVIHCDSVAQGELRLRRADGPQLKIEPLPYSVPA